MASTYAVTEPEPATTHEETPTEHQEALEKKGHKEWGKLKMAVKVEAKFHHLHKKKIICGTASIIIGTIVAIIVVAVGVAAFIYSQRLPTAEEAAQQKIGLKAVVNIGKIGVIPPKKDGTRRRLFKGYDSVFDLLEESKHRLRGLTARSLTAATIDTTLLAVDSDYHTTSTSLYVDDGLSQYLETADMIICFLSKTNANDFIDGGYYIATIDMDSCEKKKSDRGGGKGGEQKKPPNLTNWTVFATSPNATTPSGLIEITAYFNMQIGTSTTPFVFKLEAEKSQITADGDIGDLYVRFFTEGTTVEGDGDGGYSDPAMMDYPEYDMQMDGFLRLNLTTVNTSSTESYKKGQFSYSMTQSFGGMSMSQSIKAEYNEDDETGWALISATMPDYSDTAMMTGGNPEMKTTTEEVGWNPYALKGFGVCKDRVNYVPVGEQYEIFDSNGKLVNVETEMYITYVVPADIVLPALKEYPGDTCTHPVDWSCESFQWSDDFMKNMNITDKVTSCTSKALPTRCASPDDSYTCEMNGFTDESSCTSKQDGSSTCTSPAGGWGRCDQYAQGQCNAPDNNPESQCQSYSWSRGYCLETKDVAGADCTWTAGATACPANTDDSGKCTSPDGTNACENTLSTQEDHCVGNKDEADATCIWTAGASCVFTPGASCTHEAMTPSHCEFTAGKERTPSVTVPAGYTFMGMISKEYAFLFSEGEYNEETQMYEEDFDYEQLWLAADLLLPVGAVVNRLDWSDQNAVGEAFKMGKTSKKNEWGSSDNTYSLTRVADDTPFKFFDRLDLKVTLTDDQNTKQKTLSGTKHPVLDFTIEYGWLNGLPKMCKNEETGTVIAPEKDPYGAICSSPAEDWTCEMNGFHNKASCEGNTDGGKCTSPDDSWTCEYSHYPLDQNTCTSNFDATSKCTSPDETNACENTLSTQEDHCVGNKDEAGATCIWTAGAACVWTPPSACVYTDSPYYWCNYDQGMVWEIHDVIIPAGSTAVNTDAETGTVTNYLILPVSEIQMMVPIAAGSTDHQHCESITMPPTGTMPTVAGDAPDVAYAPKPTDEETADLEVKVSQGVSLGVIEEIVTDATATTTATTTAPAPGLV